MSDAATSVTLMRRLRATPQRVFEAWITPDVLVIWFGPHRTRVEAAELDPRPGGRFRIVLREDNGERHEVGGRYEAVTPHEHLCFTWAWHSMPERESRVTIRLRGIADGTELTLTHDRFADAETAARHRQGWTESLERLEALLGT